MSDNSFIYSMMFSSDNSQNAPKSDWSIGFVTVLIAWKVFFLMVIPYLLVIGYLKGYWRFGALWLLPPFGALAFKTKSLGFLTIQGDEFISWAYVLLMIVSLVVTVIVSDEDEDFGAYSIGSIVLFLSNVGLLYLFF